MFENLTREQLFDTLSDVPEFFVTLYSDKSLKAWTWVVSYSPYTTVDSHGVITRNDGVIEHASSRVADLLADIATELFEVWSRD